MTWAQAEAYAQTLGGHLVTVNDAAEQQWLTQSFSWVGAVWIGLTDQATEGTWAWSSGASAGYLNWGGGEPWNQGDSSVDAAYMTTDGSWHAYYDQTWATNFRGLIELDAASGSADVGPGARAQYLLDVDVADVVPPRVVSVAGLPAHGTTVAEPVGPSISVTLSEVLDPATVNANQRQVWSYGGHWYTLSNASSWSGAEAEAVALGGHLATVSDAGEQQWLSDAFGRFGASWIGLSDQAVEGTFSWSSGAATSYTNWAPGQPNNANTGSNDAVYLNPGDGLWYVTSDTALGSGGRGIIELSGADSDGDGVPDVVDAYPSDPLNNWSLQGAGADGTFGTADDRLYRLKLTTPYTGGTTVQFTIEGGELGAPVSLGNGQYRFSAGAMLTDVVGNALDGNGDGTGGDRYNRSFTVALPSGLTFEGENNDSAARATALSLSEDPSGSGYAVGRGIGRQDPAPYQSYFADPDYWRVELLAGDIVSVSVGTPGSELNSYVELSSCATPLVRAWSATATAARTRMRSSATTWCR
jgi:large repetitive protein